MCGIAGFVAPGRWREEELEPLARAMIDRVRHRGPDDAGGWSDPRAGATLGHCRLAVLDPTPAGHQPMASADGRYICTFNGEIYNAPELAVELATTEIRFRSHTDTEVLIEAVARWGLRPALERMNGMFAFAMWDRDREELILARDRFGEKPLYYACQPGALVFASELKALRLYPGVAENVDQRAVADVLTYGYVDAERTIHPDVHQLPPGSHLVWRGGRTSISRYWDSNEVAGEAAMTPFGGTPSEAVEEVDRLLRASVRRRLLSDVPLGAFLSGGVDSSLITAIANDLAGGGLRTFTIGFADRSFDESPFAREVARHLGTRHVERSVDDRDVQDLVPRLPDMFDEPFADSSQIPVHIVARLAREHVTVALSGDGGDELFGGYDRYAIDSMMPSSRALQRLTTAALAHISPTTVAGLARTLAPVLPRRVRVSRPQDKLRKLKGVLAANSLDEAYLSTLTLGVPARGLVVGFEGPAGARRLAAPTHLRPAERFALHDVNTYLPNDLLVKTDRATMAASLETRVPMLDPDLAYFAWSLPPHLKRKNGVGKWVLRELIKRYLPAPVVDRPKMGFGVPIGEWLRGPIRPWAEDVLGSRSLMDGDILHPAAVRRLWHEHLSRQADHGPVIWAVVSVVAWHERHLGQRQPT